jgi:valyl-tRNA synthetase
LVKTEDHINKVGFSERTNAIIEPRLSLQWFVSMKELAQPALENVMNGKIQFHPDKMKNTYRHWMENVKDWCISRQLWWGHRIPAYYYADGQNDFVVAKTIEEAAILASEKLGRTIHVSDLRQDEDALDTWFSSWLWPISVFNGLTRPGNEEIKYYYPTNDLVTAPEIMFFWVARMIIAGYEYMGELPFKNVYYTGIVRDKLGRKMSKSLGNSPDPLKLIEQYGADGVRVGVLISSPAGNDLPFDTSQCEQGRNFANKIWNAFRLLKSWDIQDIPQPEYAKQSTAWFDAKLNEATSEITDLFVKFRISDALMSTYKLVWDDFCSWYLELVKPEYGQPIDRTTYTKTVENFEKLLCLLHPFMPFITEEIWHELKNRADGDDIIVAQYPKAIAYDSAIIKSFDKSEKVISQIRTIRKEKNIANKVKLDLLVKAGADIDSSLDALLKKICNLTKLEYINDKVANAYSFVQDGSEYFIPFTDDIDVDAEIQKMQAELDYTRGFLNSVQKKLSNDKFVNSAPEAVVSAERKKEQDALNTIQILEEKIAALK